MRILFLYNALYMGGVETFLARFSKFFYAKTDIKPIIIFIEKSHNDKFLAEIKKYADVFCLNRGDFDLENITKDIQNLNLGKIEYVLNFTLSCFLIAGYLTKNIYKEAKILYYAVEPFGLVGQEGDAPATLKHILKSYPSSNIAFINSPCLNSHKKNITGYSFKDSKTLKLPINLAFWQDLKRNPEKFKIVSIGRINDTKTYNFTMLDAIEKLKEVNNLFSYHIYGDGEQFQKLKYEVEKRDLTNTIFLHGTIAYSEMTNVLASAFCFIGVGTSVLEASAAGVPSLLGIFKEKGSLTYGFFANFPEDSLGEIVDQPKFSFFESIVQLSQMTDKEYKVLSLKHQEKALEYSEENFFIQFEAFLKDSQFCKFPSRFFFKTIFFWKMLKICYKKVRSLISK